MTEEDYARLIVRAEKILAELNRIIELQGMLRQRLDRMGARSIDSSAGSIDPASSL